MKIVNVENVRLPWRQAKEIPCPRVAEVLVPSRDIERSSRLGEQACKARGAESPSIAQAIVSPPCDALAVAELDDGRFRGIDGTSDDRVASTSRCL